MTTPRSLPAARHSSRSRGAQASTGRAFYCVLGTIVGVVVAVAVVILNTDHGAAGRRALGYGPDHSTTLGLT